ncbi:MULTISPECIES: GtrA family protein [unclassified Streptococcus]|uniref:GtrA family protein n=1 Tax=unclassified Streptococcus TaxID=2608887 RepID=UPI00107256BF|nr:MULTISPECIES: GtrA family protein [unclassified Streptococcus]MBF0806673.1 GtrA family protein [Streptococcus sp. 19428wA2_WM07]TFU26698.1 GtrA family protein [Streptococcus sp. WM07]
MKTLIKKFFANEVLSYLFFGGLATLVYLILRTSFFYVTQEAVLSTAIANILTILFAFITNDLFVFRQNSPGRWQRLIKFFMARLGTFLLDIGLTFIFVTQYPGIIGQFVNNNLSLVDGIVALTSQVLIIILNYVISKLFVFTSQNHP